jgi:hypothetical protein
VIWLRFTCPKVKEGYFLLCIVDAQKDGEKSGGPANVGEFEQVFETATAYFL